MPTPDPTRPPAVCGSPAMPPFRAPSGQGGTRPARARRMAPALLAAALLLAGRAPAQAADDWAFSLTPYAFLPVSTSGSSTIAGRSADVDLELNDVFELLNFAGALRAEAWYGSLGLVVDGYYTNIGAKTRVEAAGGLLAAEVKVSSRQGWVSMLGAYRVIGPAPASGGIGPTLDLAAGVRVNMIDQEVRLRGAGDPGLAPGLQRALGGEETFVEPQVSLRGSYPLSEAWSVAARVDLSGFGVGGDTLQWLVLAGAEWRATGRTALQLGWQVYGIDFETDRADGRFGLDVVQTGPYLGSVIRF